MSREIIKDKDILSQKSERFVFGEDDYLIKELIDTANEHKERCLGLACNQIGVPKRIIVVKQGDNYIPFINPIIVKKSTDFFMANERCLSLEGQRDVRRYTKIKLVYSTSKGKSVGKEFFGLTAQIIQHLCDHLNGVLIW